MTYLNALLLGLVEGLTEFLPISSTFHLILSSKLLGISQTDFVKLFEVVIQSGAILAVIVNYFNLEKDLKLMSKVLVSFIPTSVIGLILYKVIKGFFFEQELLQLLVFFGVGVLFIGLERWWKNKSFPRGLSDVSYLDALKIGLFQALAVVPGVSRSGAVIIGMMLLGVNRRDSAKYSFLLAVPTIFAATIFDLFKMREVWFGGGFYSLEIVYILLGFGVAFLSALFCVRWLISFLEKHTLEAFGWYRIGFSVVILFLMFLAK